MKITRDEAKRIADLAHLELDQPGLDRMAAEMTKILGYIDQLGDAPAAAVATPPTPMREDEVRAGIDRDGVAQNAPAFDNGFFVVPKVIE
jgi:aspartyl-tRNA(Asn)/glutamyl-tRNA(Gln) amidotransferase subunit C